jgi:hypothetical protein
LIRIFTLYIFKNSLFVFASLLRPCPFRSFKGHNFGYPCYKVTGIADTSRTFHVFPPILRSAASVRRSKFSGRALKARKAAAHAGFAQHGPGHYIIMKKVS